MEPELNLDTMTDLRKFLQQIGILDVVANGNMDAQTRDGC